MKSDLTYWLDRFHSLNVLVIGEAMLDTYLRGTTNRVCREAPVPIVALGERNDAPGGAANTAVNAASLGARVRFLSVVGNDAEGMLLRQLLERHTIRTDGVITDPERQTLSKNRLVASAQLLVRFDQGSTDAVGVDSEQKLIASLEVAFPRCQAVIISDYGYGILTPRVVETLNELHRRHPRTVVADAKDLRKYRSTGLTAIKPNYQEALQLIGEPNGHEPLSRAEWCSHRSERLLNETGSRLVAVTLDVDGAIILERDRPPHRTSTRPTSHSRAAGAGDTFLAALALALAAGADREAAAELASAACAVAVTREGTTPCTMEELRTHLAADLEPPPDTFALLRRLEPARSDNRRIVFTNGCFDILHRGHITYLSQAKALGDILVVGVNSDDSVRRLKGSSRPINSLADRMGVLAALHCVDHVIAFDEDTPCELVRAIRPDIFVKGGDYTLDRLPEASIVEAYGGSVRILPFVADRSTTDLIERILSSHSPGNSDSIVFAEHGVNSIVGLEASGSRL